MGYKILRSAVFFAVVVGPNIFALNTKDSAEPVNQPFRMFELGIGGGIGPYSQLLNLGYKHGKRLTSPGILLAWYEFGGNVELERFDDKFRLFAKPEIALSGGITFALVAKLSVFAAIAYDNQQSGLMGFGSRPTICLFGLCGYYSAEFMSDNLGWNHTKAGLYVSYVFCGDKLCLN